MTKTSGPTSGATLGASSVPAAAKLETRQQTARCDGHAPVLITENEVRFGTAAVVRPPARRNVVTLVTGAMTAVAAQWRTRTERRSVRPHYPSRLSYLEDSLMAREMDRL
ncbi:hypothetical protein FR943_21755 [Mycobacterium sp. TNTM28]|uniref:Uncharacterized protein n=1 Tax=[Mycobacterium] fortunisiensis TaxID=2600579 RepID=A0ABS6KS30_9MYCO|nr:hypothetical protein [[Mycobacterium] fortunisiensis]MBU9766458.1 hypothetical protein [[Mycobacterium] fortunisiensis]